MSTSYLVYSSVCTAWRISKEQGSVLPSFNASSIATGGLRGRKESSTAVLHSISPWKEKKPHERKERGRNPGRGRYPAGSRAGPARPAQGESDQQHSRGPRWRRGHRVHFRRRRE